MLTRFRRWLAYRAAVSAMIDEADQDARAPGQARLDAIDGAARIELWEKVPGRVGAPPR